jgi:Heterokaryon incompatibility protein (HET)
MYKYLCVDAICINQLNLEEKTSQVRLMLDIFKQADIVIIRLGEQRETGRIAVNLAYQIYAAAQMVGFEKFARMVFRSQATRLPPVWTHHWRALWSLLDREWFTRVWVVQEFFVAKDYTMLCGSLFFNAAILLHVALPSGTLKHQKSL